MVRSFSSRERLHAREREAFDPVREGMHRGLSRESAQSLWDHVQTSVTGGASEDLQRQFFALVARAARGRRTAEVGRVTRVDTAYGDVDPWLPQGLLASAPDRNPPPARPALPMVHRKEDAGGAAADPTHPVVREALDRRGAGDALPATIQGEMERAFGIELTRVRIHIDALADRAARALHAQAFTVGEDIFFAAGAFAPSAPAGRQLLAHELAHVVQGWQGRTQAAAGDAARVSRPGDSLEREADAIAERVGSQRTDERGGRSMKRIDRMFGAPAHGFWRTPTTGASTTISGETPIAMSVALSGITLVVPENVRFTAGARLVQGLAVALRRLIGAAYHAGMENDLAAHLRAGGLHGSGSLAGVARGGEAMGTLTLSADIATRILGWLDAHHAAVDLSPAQRELLSLGMATTQAWRGFPAHDLQELGEALPPAWVRYDLFVAEVAHHGAQLRAYVTAMERFRASSEDGDRAAAVAALRALLDAVNVAARVLEAVRTDAALAPHPAYRALWPTRAGQPPRVAAATTPPSTRSAELFLVFVPTQPALARTADSDPAARRELLERFSRFVVTAATSGGSGDQVIQDQPGRANAPPHPSQMSSYPALQPPLYEAALQTDHRFSMALQFPTVFDAFAHYSYFWERIRIPDSQIAGVVDADHARGRRPTWGEVGSARMSRSTRYAQADLGRAIEQITGSLGTAGVGALEVAAAAAIFRYLGTGIRLAFEIITRPANEQAVVFPEEGLYLVRCRAVPVNGDDAEVVRAPSVAYLPVFARAGAQIAEAQVQATGGEHDQALARIAEIDAALRDPGAAHRSELEAERAELAASIGSVSQRIALQQRLLQDRLRSVAADSPEAASIHHQLEALEQMLAVRASRAGDLVGAEVLNATFVSDEGQTLRLLMEAAPRPPSGARQRYYVSDLTTPNSTHAEGAGATRADAILAAIQSILEAAVGAYGRGQVAVQIDGRTFSRRIEAGQAALLMETIENVTTVLSIAAVAAAPFTGGASLSILLPVGAIGAIPAAFRLATRAENGTLRLDLQAAMDVVNLAGGLIGLGQAATPLRMVRLSGALMIAGIATNGTGMLLMGAGMVAQIEMLANLPPGLRAARMMEVIAQGMIAAGLLVGTALAERARARQAEAAVAATDDEAARGITSGYDAEAGMSGQRGNQGPMRSEQLSMDGVEVTTEFNELSGRVQHFVRQMERRGWVRTGEVSPAELTELSRWFGREIGVVQNPNTGRLRLILGTRNGVMSAQVRPGEIFLVHTHPVMTSETGHFSGVDIPSAGARVEAVVDWSGMITYFNREGVLNPRSGTGVVEPMDYNAGFMNAQGMIVGYGTIRWVPLGNGTFQVTVR